MAVARLRRVGRRRSVRTEGRRIGSGNGAGFLRSEEVLRVDVGSYFHVGNGGGRNVGDLERELKDVDEQKERGRWGG